MSGDERKIGRYRVLGEIASGGMATVYLGRLEGPARFARLVAIKSLHAQYAKDPDFLSMFLDEARLASRVRHPNVAPILDVLSQRGELHLVMEYVEGEALSRLVRLLRQRAERVPLRVAVGVMTDVLDGLHAAHEATDDGGEALGIVHRDISPQNILVGIDGVSRIVDFGIAKAVGRMQTTRGDQLKGKIAYMPPEQLSRDPLDRRADVYAAGIVLWELLVGARLFYAEDEISTFKLASEAKVDAPSSRVPEIPAELDAIVLRALSRDPTQRFATARDMAMALERTRFAASAREVGDWLLALAGPGLAERAKLLNAGESGPASAEEIATDSGLSLPSAIAARLSIGDAATAIIPVSGAQPAAAAPSKRPWLLPSALAAALLALPLVWWVSRQTAPPAALSTPSPPPTIVAVIPPPLVSEEPKAPVAPSATTALAPAPRRAASTRARPRKVDCQNPFKVDAKGVRVPRLECL
jgi:eukaryotic-like serine/threonine-protein kinase